MVQPRALAGIGSCMRYRPHQSPAVPSHRSATSLDSFVGDRALLPLVLLLPCCLLSADATSPCWLSLVAARTATRSSTLSAAARSVSVRPSDPAHCLSTDTASCAA